MREASPATRKQGSGNAFYPPSTEFARRPSQTRFLSHKLAVAVSQIFHDLENLLNGLAIGRSISAGRPFASLAWRVH
jgi:hypothetical protein